MATFPDQRPTESPQAYEAACTYFGMGADRSTAVVAQRLRKSVSLMNRWSGAHDWVERSRAYDQAVQHEIAAQRSAQYIEDVKEHQQRYRETGKALHGVGVKLLRRFANEIENLELTPNSLAVLVKALTTAGDLEAHALSLDELLPQLERGE